MPSRCGGSGAESRDGEGETSTAPGAGAGLGSTVAPPKRGTSAAVGGAERGELVELAGWWRELRRLLSGLRGTWPPVWRWRGDAALWLARSESALLGERTGEARGAGLAERGPVAPLAWAGVWGPLPSASGCGLMRRALASLWRGEALLTAAVAVRLRGWSGGLVSSVGGAASRSVRRAAAAAGGGVVGRGRHWRPCASCSPAGRPVRPRLGVVGRWVAAVLAWLFG